MDGSAATARPGRGPSVRGCLDNGEVIARYTRPELGAIWTDEARLEAWRRVEVAAAEELDGPSADEIEAIRAATVSVEAGRGRERGTEHHGAPLVRVLGQ